MSIAERAPPDPCALEHLPGDGGPRGVPLLFVHGAFATPWVWRRHFMPWFAARGHDVFAVRLRDAGERPGALFEPGLQDYLDDLHTAVDGIGHAPVVVGHSLGALVAQMALGRLAMQGLALLAPVPATGMFWSSVRLAMRAPGLWGRTVLSTADAGFATASAAREALFSPATDTAVVTETHGHLRAQPARPLLEAQWPRHVPRAGRLRIPVLTMAAEHDRLIPADVVERTASYHDAHHVTLDGAGHALMLDHGWETAAAHLAHWVDALPR